MTAVAEISGAAHRIVPQLQRRSRRELSIQMGGLFDNLEGAVARNFKDLSEQEILALAISSEETDARVYADYAEGLRADYPATSQIFKEMEAEEDEHRRELIEDYRRRFGEHIPLIRREDVKGFVHRKPAWMIRPLGIK